MYRQLSRWRSRKSDHAHSDHAHGLPSSSTGQQSAGQAVTSLGQSLAKAPETLADAVQLAPAPAPVPNIGGDASTLAPQVGGVEESEYGLKELVSQPPGSDDAVDVIAIHGLNGHREKTWTDKATRVNWLSDPTCLPSDIPHARVLSFGYNSASHFGRGDSDVRDFASELLAAVKASRRSDAERRRPIVFVCHSLGGLVFKQAIVRGHEQDHFYGPLLDNVKGVIFFATPHRGSDLAFWDHIAARVAQAATLGFSFNTKLSKDLKVNSEMLKRISESFTYRGWNFKIRSFYETELMQSLNCRVVEKGSATLGWGNELDIASPSTHATICKFPSASDQRYRTAAFALLDVIDLPTEPADRPFTNKEENCMIALNSDYENQLDQVDEPVPDTCEWVLSNDKWQEWNSWPGAALLWITSNAGCGKSVMAKFLVNYFQTQRQPGTTRNFGYFFFMDGIAGQDNASLAVSALMHQLYASQHGLIKHAMKKFEETPPRIFNKLTTLWSILANSIDDEDAKDVLWILDGLDECDPQSLRQFMKSLSAYFDSNDNGRNRRSRNSVKIILLSRPSSLIQQVLGLFAAKDLPRGTSNKIRLVGEDETKALMGDILRFARWKNDELASASALPDEILARMHERLVAGADFTFLWISLVIKMIEDSTVNGISVAQLLKILDATNLDDVYLHFLESASRALPEKTRKLLSIMLAAVRPLTVEEMCVAVEVDAEAEVAPEKSLGSQPLEHVPVQSVFSRNRKNLAGTGTSQGRASLKQLGEHLHKPFDNHIRQLCGHFVRIRHGRLYFVHQTARSFLINTSFKLERNLQPTVGLTGQTQALTQKAPDELTVTDETDGMWDSIQWDRANQTLLKICVNYIMLFDRAEKDIDFDDWGNEEIAAFMETCREDPTRAFFPYAAIHWIQHYRPLRKALEFQFDELLQPETKLFRTWTKVHPGWYRDRQAAETVQGAKWIGEAAAQQSELPSAFTLTTPDFKTIEGGSSRDLRRRFESLYIWVVALRDTGRSIPSQTSNKLDYVLRGLKEEEHKESDDFHLMILAPDRGETKEKKLEMDTMARLNELKRWLSELEAEKRQSLHDDPGLQTLLAEKQVDFQENFNMQQRALLTQAKAEEELHEVLIHFGLFRLEEGGLEEDEFLSKYWQSNVELNPEQASGERAVLVDEEEEMDPEGEEIEDIVPDRVKHYIREKRKLFVSGSGIKGTPGADLPELSNPSFQSFDDHMKWRRSLDSRHLQP